MDNGPKAIYLNRHVDMSMGRNVNCQSGVVLVTYLIIVTKQNSNSRKEKFTLTNTSRGMSILAANLDNNSMRQLAILSSVRKQKAGVQLAFCFLFLPGPQIRGWCCPYLEQVPTSVNLIQTLPHRDPKSRSPPWV